MRYVYLIFIVGIIGALAILGPRGAKSTRPPLEVFPDMDRMPRYDPQAESAFFSDGRTDRLPVEGAVARGSFYENEYLATGRNGENFGKGFPIDVSNELWPEERSVTIFTAPFAMELREMEIA